MKNHQSILVMNLRFRFLQKMELSKFQPHAGKRRLNVSASVNMTLSLIVGFCLHIGVSVAASTDQIESPDKLKNYSELHLKHRLIPLSDPVYQVIDYFEIKGVLNPTSLVKPYTKETIVAILNEITDNKTLSDKERKIAEEYLGDLTADSNSLELVKTSKNNNFFMAGTGGEINVRSGFSGHGSTSYTGIVKPFITGDLGHRITYTAALGLGGEKLSADIFFQSYTRNSQVAFPNDQFGYSWLPYQFKFYTDWTHYKSGWNSPLHEKPQLALFTHTELNSSWFEGALQISLNNQYRSWGHSMNNLLLSSSARSFPGFEIKLQPYSWFKYTFLAGSLFFLPMEHGPHLMNVYETDLGRMQKMLSLHMLEITPRPWLQLTAAGNAIWAKRMEIAYFMPFLVPSLAQDYLGDRDNMALYFDLATRLGKLGKTWIGLYIDDFSLTSDSKIMRIPTNKYAWQGGWKTNLLSSLIPGTLATLCYTRVTPFVYTHYPESNFSTGNERPIDMTYSHDGFNLGFYLPPNSAECALKIENIIVPNLILTSENKLIVHGTNDLAQPDYQIFGDIFRPHSGGDKTRYPYLDFMNDGIYDYTISSEFRFDWKVRGFDKLNYFRIIGSLGAARTWWESNNSGVKAPDRMNFITGNLGILVDI